MKVCISRRSGIFAIAAETFADLWKQITGQAPEIVTEAPGTGDFVLIGTDADNAYLHEKMEDGIVPDLGIRIGSDEYRLLSVADGSRTMLILAGGGKRAFLYAVYDYFERVGHCAYFWDGDRIPKAASLPLTGLDEKESPRFQYRGLRYFAHRSLTRFQAEHWDFPDWKKELDWCLKKRFDFFMLRIGMDDLFQRAFPEIVPYPDRDGQLPEAKDRSFDDRNLFWSLQYRGELRKKIMDYARERGLIAPEDCGTMSHWYSRTPKAFLNAVKPDFVPQMTAGYSEETGLVWDIRQDKYLDLYWKLTETYIRDFGSGEMFHTIGLAERGCYADKAKNHEFKLYAYRRIISKLREHYPHAPLLIGTWDFVGWDVNDERWSIQQVHDLLNELDPENTILFDYISDTIDERHNFTNWNVIRKFPYFFGIFHAYEACSDIRGNYDVIERRLPLAAEDPMCKGMISWPENSHADTLMLEYLAANSWKPSADNVKIASFLEKFLAKRCNAPQGEKLADVWRTMLPLIKVHYWRSRSDERWRDLYPDLLFSPLHNQVYFNLNADYLENCLYQTYQMAPFIDRVPQIFRKLAELDFASLDGMLFRDAIDLARTAALRISNFGIFRAHLKLDAWKKQMPDADAETLLAAIHVNGELIRALADLLAAHEDYSMYDSLKRLERCQPTNPNFEHTLKGNAETWYCRSFIYELFRGCYIPEYDALEAEIAGAVQRGDHSYSGQPQSLKDKLEEIRDAYYNTPLKDLAPDHTAAKKALPATLNALAEISGKIIELMKDLPK